MVFFSLLPYTTIFDAIPGGVTKNHILGKLREKHDLHMRVHRYADLGKIEGDKSFIRR